MLIFKSTDNGQQTTDFVHFLKLLHFLTTIGKML